MKIWFSNKNKYTNTMTCTIVTLMQNLNDKNNNDKSILIGIQYIKNNLWHHNKVEGGIVKFWMKLKLSFYQFKIECYNFKMSM